MKLILALTTALLLAAPTAFAKDAAGCISEAGKKYCDTYDTHWASNSDSLSQQMANERHDAAEAEAEAESEK